MKKLFCGILGFAMMFMMFTSVSASATTSNLEWKVGEGNMYGFATRVSDLVTKLEGAKDKDTDNNAFTGPYTFNSADRLSDGDIINEITVNVKRADILKQNDSKVGSTGAQQGFFISNELEENDTYKTEARVSTVNENGKVYVYLDWHKSDNKYEVTEDGLYTYRWRWYKNNSKVNLVVSLIKDGKEVYKTDEIDMDVKVPEDLSKMSAGYMWFYGINMDSGIEVYSKVPETTIKPEINSNGTASVENSQNLGNILKESLKNFPELVEMADSSDVTISLDAKKTEVSDEVKNEFASVNKNMNVSDFFDISILVKSSEKTGYITELTEPIKLSVAIPENLPTVKKGYVRKYYVLRKHDNKIETLNTTVSKDGKNISFETDKFSTYAVAYADEASVNNPKTYDGIINYFILGGASLLIVAGIGIYLSKKKLHN